MSLNPGKEALDRLLGWARTNKLNNSKLAKRMDVKPQHINNWIRRKGGLPPERWARASKLTGLTVDELIGRAADRARVEVGVADGDGPEWPFDLDIERYEALDDVQKKRLEDAVRLALEGCEYANAMPIRKVGKGAKR
jgi:hypothetical protein